MGQQHYFAVAAVAVLAVCGPSKPATIDSPRPAFATASPTPSLIATPTPSAEPNPTLAPPTPSPELIPTTTRTPEAAVRVATPAPPPIPVIGYGAVYSDCSGATPLANRQVIYWDTCVSGHYLLAHNPGIGGWFFSFGAGSQLRFQGAVYQVRQVVDVTPAQAWNLAHSDPAPLALQSCNDLSGAIVRVVRAWPV